MAKGTSYIFPTVDLSFYVLLVINNKYRTDALQHVYNVEYIINVNCSMLQGQCQPICRLSPTRDHPPSPQYWTHPPRCPVLCTSPPIWMRLAHALWVMQRTCDTTHTLYRKICRLLSLTAMVSTVQKLFFYTRKWFGSSMIIIILETRNSQQAILIKFMSPFFT